MGAPRLTPGRGCRRARRGASTSSAASGTPTSARRCGCDGTHHRVDGAKRGPAPAHDIPIWLGAYKPRMLAPRRAQGRRLAARASATCSPATSPRERPHRRRRAGRRARPARDPPAAEPRRRVVLRHRVPAGTARAVGRRPAPARPRGRHLRRSSSASDDDAHARASSAQEVAPALREAVAAERADAGTVTGAVRPVGGPGQAPRRASTTTPCPRPSSASAVEPGDREYGRVRSSYVYAGSPGLVLRPHDAAGGQRRAGLRARAGRAVRGPQRRSRDQRPVDERRRHRHRRRARSTRSRCSTATGGLVRLGAGARWGDVAAALSPHGLAISSGDYGDVGVGGLVTAGGQGFLARSYGLTLDHVVAAELVLADGRHRAHRRRARARPPVGRARRGRQLRHPHRRRDRGRRGGQRRPRDDRLRRHGHRRRSSRRGPRWSRPRRASSPASSRWSPARGQNPAIGYAIVVWADDDTEAAVVSLERFLDLAPVLQQQAQLVPYAAVVAAAPRRSTPAARDSRVRGGLVEHVTPELAALLADLLAARRRGHGAAAGGRRRGQRRGPGGDRVRAPDAELLAARVGPRQPSSRRSTPGGSGSHRTWTASTSASRPTSPPPASPRRSRPRRSRASAGSRRSTTRTTCSTATSASLRCRTDGTCHDDRHEHRRRHRRAPSPRSSSRSATWCSPPSPTTDAWRLGCLLVELAQERDLPVTVDIQHGHAAAVPRGACRARPPDNDTLGRAQGPGRRAVRGVVLPPRAAREGQGHHVRRRSTTCRCSSTPRTVAPSRCGCATWASSASSRSRACHRPTTTRSSSRP